MALDLKSFAIGKANGGGSGLTDAIKSALLNCFAHVAWIDNKGQEYYDDLESALNGGQPIIRYSITNTLTNCINTSDLVSIKQGQTYNAEIQPNSGYTLETVTCTMGGVEQEVVNGVINITSVTGNIVITATAKITKRDGGLIDDENWRDYSINSSLEPTVKTNIANGVYTMELNPDFTGTPSFNNVSSGWINTPLSNGKTYKLILDDVSMAYYLYGIKSINTSQTKVSLTKEIIDGTSSTTLKEQTFTPTADYIGLSIIPSSTLANGGKFIFVNPVLSEVTE